jgi:cytochrome c oxidase subunit IV
MSADHGHPEQQQHGTPPDVAAGLPGHHPTEKPHPDIHTYWKVAVILTIITIVEVWAYYVPAWVASRVFVPSLLIMSAAKFVIVVLFYMHLRYDHKLFKALFTGPLIIAIVTVIALLFLFGHLSVRLNGGA